MRRRPLALARGERNKVVAHCLELPARPLWTAADTARERLVLRNASRLASSVRESERLKAACSINLMGAPMNRHSDQVVNDIAARYFLVLGAAAADLWSELPQELQHQLFEHAVVLGHQGEQDESLREQLAKFLHDHHERTLAR